jgi:hypothetical protein
LPSYWNVPAITVNLAGATAADVRLDAFELGAAPLTFFLIGGGKAVAKPLKSLTRLKKCAAPMRQRYLSAQAYSLR